MEFKNIISPDTLDNLVALLNQHIKETKKPNEDIGEYLNYAGDGTSTFLYEIDGAYYDVNECVIMSKKYGFIKWLVENDKIEPLGKYICWETDEDEPYIKFDLSDQYIAYLSIQDNPIEFLVSILK